MRRPWIVVQFPNSAFRLNLQHRPRRGPRLAQDRRKHLDMGQFARVDRKLTPFLATKDGATFEDVEIFF